jgi:2-dehydro-3-deoxy-D-arabinonate dehydratase
VTPFKIYRIATGLLVEKRGEFRRLNVTDWNAFINDDYLYEKLTAQFLKGQLESHAEELIRDELLAPIDKQEVWAAGVTYLRSREARMEESKHSGGESFYDKVYEAERPELFFKATAQRTVGSGAKVNIRKDSTWDVPEPELTLFITSNGHIVGHTIGNDMSSRSIEGENPLYLPQAKVFEKCAALGPCILVPGTPFLFNGTIEMEILRNGTRVFTGSVQTSQMKRTPIELVQFLLSECEFPYGCFLMTGTGMVPPNDFTLKSGDEIRISIAEIGTLVNNVA